MKPSQWALIANLPEKCTMVRVALMVWAIKGACDQQFPASALSSISLRGNKVEFAQPISKQIIEELKSRPKSAMLVENFLRTLDVPALQAGKRVRIATML